VANYKDYSMTSDTLNGVLDSTSLHNQISSDATIGNSFDGINRVQGSDSFSCQFTSDLSAGDITILDGIVSAHDGVAVEDPAASVTIQSAPPFASKLLPGGKKLFRRVHGVKATLSGDTDFILTIPYAQCKINGLEIVWAPVGLQVDLKILDSTTGTYTTIPNYQLNQFGFATGIAEHFYTETSNYDADLYINMQVKCTILNPDSLTDTICVNFILHEVV